MTVSVIVPVWNGKSDLARLLASLRLQTVRPEEVIVVDNASTDGAGEFAEAQGARVVRFTENRGFAVAVNRGVAESTGQRLAILNSDVELEPDWLAHLTAAVMDDAVWFATGLILSASRPDRVDGSWDLVSRAMMPWRAGQGWAANTPAFQRDRPIAMASFTAILMRRELWKRVGELDAQFESYLEDVDFGLRCLRAGFAGRFVAAAHCHHRGSASLGRWHEASVRQMSRNQVTLVRKHLGDPLISQWWWQIAAGQLLWLGVAAAHGALFPALLGKWQGLQRVVPALANSASFPALIADQERQILELQARYGFDRYWRWYHRLAGLAGNSAGAE